MNMLKMLGSGILSQNKVTEVLMEENIFKKNKKLYDVKEIRNWVK